MPKAQKKNSDYDGENKAKKTWDFTIWCDRIDKDEQKERLERWCADATRMQVSEEICPDTGKVHWQCKMTWRIAKRWSAMRKLLGDGIHVTASKCMCFAYCDKLDAVKNIISHDGRRQGCRTDLEEACAMVKEGASIKDLTTEHTAVMVKYGRGIREVMAVLLPKVDKPKYPLDDLGFHGWEPITDWSRTHVLVGPAGIGKTHFAKSHFPGGFLFISQIEGLKEFDPAVHTGIVFDDMSFAHMPREAQIHLVDQDDRRDIYARYTNVSIPANTKKIICVNRRDIFAADDAAIERRLQWHELDCRGQFCKCKLRD